jgi:hypothetical protein
MDIDFGYRRETTRLPESSHLGRDDCIYPMCKAAALVRYMEARGRGAEEMLKGSGLRVESLRDPHPASTTRTNAVIACSSP